MHHVTSRSNAEECIFKDAADYITGITILGGLVTEGLLVCHAFCLMPTHHHVLGTFDDASKFAHAFNRAYAVAYNRRYGRRGHVFHSPPSLTAIRSRRQLRNTVTYIALNPDDYEKWPYASYPGLIGTRPAFSFVDPNPVLDAVGDIDALRAFIAQSSEVRSLR